MINKITKSLKILIVNQSMSARSELKNMLATLEQSNVDLSEELVNMIMAIRVDNPPFRTAGPMSLSVFTMRWL